MPPVLAATLPSLLGRMLEMPLSVLLCALEMCFLTVNHTQTPTPVVVPFNGTVLRIGLPQADLNLTTTSVRPPPLHHVQRVPPPVHRMGAGIEAPGEPHHHPSSMTDRLDAINMDMVLKNTRLVNSFVKCMLDKGPCTAEGREMKREMLEVLHTGCSTCSEKTKTRLKKTYRRMRSDPKMRESYKKVLNKYDPYKKYIENLEKFLIN